MANKLIVLEGDSQKADLPSDVEVISPSVYFSDETLMIARSVSIQNSFRKKFKKLLPPIHKFWNLRSHQGITLSLPPLLPPTPGNKEGGRLTQCF